MFRVIELSDKEEWKRIIKSSYKYDFYHTYDYHLLASDQNEGKPKLFVYEYNNEIIAIPLIERIIDNKKNLKDYTSVYGYAGPIANIQDISEECIHGFKDELKKYFINENVVSVFSRLHPLIDQKKLLNEIGSVEKLNKTVTIDLNLTNEEQWRKYRKSNKSEINKLKKSVNCKVAQTEDEINEYIDIYYQNMERINAGDRYFFNKDYFLKLINSNDFKTEIILAEENNEIMAGGMFIYTNDIIQYHLAATKEKFLSKTPMKLILDEIRIKGTNSNFNLFHLGGGVGNKEDSLFKFKSGFSDKFSDFNIWKFVVNQNLYNELVDVRRNEINDYNYFPLYRG